MNLDFLGKGVQVTLYTERAKSYHWCPKAGYSVINQQANIHSNTIGKLDSSAAGISSRKERKAQDVLMKRAVGKYGLRDRDPRVANGQARVWVKRILDK